MLCPPPPRRISHGQIEGSRMWTARANVILVNVIADAKAKPMIVVMPYGHVPREISRCRSRCTIRSVRIYRGVQRRRDSRRVGEGRSCNAESETQGAK